MSVLVADTSGLVSLGCATNGDLDPLALCLETYETWIPPDVVDELQEIASFDDVHGQAATAALARAAEITIKPVELDEGFPLDTGEHAAVMLANDIDAELMLCDEFNRLGLIHASLTNTRLVTTPTLLAVFVRTGQLQAGDAIQLLDEISQYRSWETNSYVERARSLFSE